MVRCVISDHLLICFVCLVHPKYDLPGLPWPSPTPSNRLSYSKIGFSWIRCIYGPRLIIYFVDGIFFSSVHSRFQLASSLPQLALTDNTCAALFLAPEKSKLLVRLRLLSCLVLFPVHEAHDLSDNTAENMTLCCRLLQKRIRGQLCRRSREKWLEGSGAVMAR